MFKKSTYVVCLILLVVALGNATFHNPSINKNFRKPLSSALPPQGYTGTTSGLYCNTSGCHNSFALNSGGGSITASALPSAYTAGTAYKFSVVVKHGASDRVKWGFSIAARNSAGVTVGTFSSTNANAAPNGDELSHLNAVVTSPQSSFTYNNLTWTAPSTVGSNDNNITFYFAGVAGNNDALSTSDYVYASTKTACALPPQPGTISGPAKVCPGSTKTYSITPVSGATSYKWILPAGATISGPKTGTSVKIIWGSTGGKLKVKALSACGSSKTRGKTITIISCFAIAQEESENASVAKHVVANIYPNPTHGNIKLQFESLAASDYSVRIVNFIGKEVTSLQGKSKEGLNEIQLDLSKFSKGIYLVQLQQANGAIINRKVMLQ